MSNPWSVISSLMLMLAGAGGGGIGELTNSGCGQSPTKGSARPAPRATVQARATSVGCRRTIAPPPSHKKRNAANVALGVGGVTAGAIAARHTLQPAGETPPTPAPADLPVPESPGVVEV
jgi:hypothetical protein